MAWRMPAETAPHERIWMAFPVEGTTLGDTDALREEGYATWTAVAAAVTVMAAVAVMATIEAAGTPDLDLDDLEADLPAHADRPVAKG